MKTIVVINQKGGVGKSTTAGAIGAGFKNRGERVLFLDLDAQGNLSDTFGASASDIDFCQHLTRRSETGKREALTQSCIYESPLGDLIPASPSLASADISINGVGKENRLKELLQPVQGHYDRVIIDTPPALGILTVNALTAADGAVIPAMADPYSLQGIAQLYDTFQAIKEYCNPDLKILGIVLTRYNPRAILNREVADMMQESAEMMGTKVFETYIRECVALREAQATRQDIFSYAPKCNASQDYNRLLEELIIQVGEGR